MARKRKNPLLPYENKWVAITQDGKKVITSATTIKTLDKKLEKMERKDVIMTKVLPFSVSYSSFHHVS